MFMGTPHQGGEGVAWGKRLVDVASIFVKTNDKLLNILEKDSEILQQQLARAGNLELPYYIAFDLTGVPKTSDLNIHWVVPRPVNDLFTGRSELLLRIEKAIYCDPTSSPDKQKRFVITGMGGQGKSEICLKVASQMRKQFWGVFWVDVDKVSTAKSDFIAIAKRLGHSAESVHDALEVLASSKQIWLLILDNADDPNFDYQVYFPSGTHGAVLITSRVAECKRYSPDVNEALEGLQEEDSKELLLKAAEIPQESWPFYSDQAGIVVQLLGSHTLALIQAGAYIARGHCPLHKYPEVYQQQRKRLLKFQPKQAKSRYCDVYTTFEASAEILQKSESETAKDALDLLAILSMLDSAVLPLQIFQSAWDSSREVLSTSYKETSKIDTISQSHVKQLPGFLVAENHQWDPFRLNEASSELVSLSLVTRHDINGLVGLSMHPLTHAWAKDRQDLEQQKVAWITTGSILALSRADSAMWQKQERRLLPHLQSYLDIEIKRAFDFGSKALVIPILLKCGWVLLAMRQDLKLSSLLKEVFIEIGKSPNKPLKEFLPLYDLQARSLSNMGKSQMAVNLLEQVVQIHKTTLAETHPNRLASLHVLASAYQANGQVTEAIELLEQVVQIHKTTLAETHPHRLNSQHNLAMAYQANGQVTEAIKLLEQVVQIRKTTQAETHPDRLTSLHVLASAYQANGQVTEAIELLEQVVQIRKTTLAETHPDRLTSLHVLASAYQANGQVTEAIELLEQVVQIRKTTLAETHPDRLASQHALAMAYQANGQVTEAIELLEQVVQIQATTQAETHPDRLASQHALASAYQANGQVTEAIELLEQVVQIRKTTQAETHPHRLASQHVLAMAYQANGQVTKAIELLEQVVQIRKTTLAETHPDRLASLHNLASAYQANGQVTEAIELLGQVVQVHKTVLAGAHPDRLTSLHALAGAYQANGQVTEAIELLEQVVQIRKTMLAETHPHRLASQDALASLLQRTRL
ncbi:hypothetical protein BGZ60DRAFT_279597 [Tricladium varicosporioides]|nr:hypothetical protein BGZ60DRAFT_279597 [Hymenoscyphus varicosporioides]